ncbi:MAG: glycosyltransferase family 4 protein [Patescibacteria group bacterium]
MKILFLTGDLKKIGGIQTYNKDVIGALNDLRIELLVVEYKNKGIINKIRFIFLFLSSVFKFQPTIIFCGHINFSLPVYFVKKLMNYDYVVFTYGIDVWEIKSNLKIKSLENARVVVSISRYTAEKLKQQMSTLISKIYLLSNAIDGKKFYPKNKSAEILSKYKLSSNNKIILTVARLSSSEKYKGYDNVIKAMSMILEEIPEARYMIVGSGDDLERVRNLIKKSNLEEYVILAGKVEEMVDYYNLCDVFAMPSKGEGFGFVFLEALACGKPVVAGNADGSVDAVLDGKIGLLVNPDNLNEISGAILGVLKHKIDSRLLDREFLRKAVLDAYGIDKFREKVEDLLYELQK